MPLDVPDSPETISIIDNFKLPDWYDPSIPWDDQTPDKKKAFLDYYRFSGYRPGMYQAVTGMGDAVL